jgi:2-polyprenyl-6-methoxyphenol hydroxylase-like FAD-dependent oxidoreductase
MDDVPDVDRDTGVLVVGAGLAGLALAGFCRQRGLRVDLIERVEAWDRVGYGIGLWGNGLRACEELGVDDAIRSAGRPVDRFEMRTPDGERLSATTFDPPPFVAVHRADLHAALREAVPGEWIRMGTTVDRLVEGEDGVDVTLSDGTERRYELVVGADGVHSRVRDLALSAAAWRLEDRPTVAWSFWTDREVPDATVDVWTPGAEAFVTRVDGRGLVNVGAAMDPDETPSGPAIGELERVARRLGWEVPLLVAARAAEPFYDRSQEVHAERWASEGGRVLLVGDAAHAVHPISGQGATLALEDAYALAGELARTPDRPDRAVEPFVDRRRGRVDRMQRDARFEERATFAESRLLGVVRNALVAHTPVLEWFVERQGATDGATWPGGEP